MPTNAEIDAKTGKTVTNMDRLDVFVNGTPNQTVTTDNGPVKPISALVGEAQVNVDAAVSAAASTQALFTQAQAVLPRTIAAETGAVFQFRWGNRSFGRFTRALGWLFPRLTLSAAGTAMDDTPALPLQSRIARQTPVETGVLFRVRIANRELFRWTLKEGFKSSRMTLSATGTVLDDDPTTPLLARLGGGGGGGTSGLTSGPDIVCWGDSLTAGAGGGGTTYPNVLAATTGRTVWNMGVGGETSSTIMARAGAVPFIAIVQGGSIPASGSVVVTLTAADGTAVAPRLQGDAGIDPVRLAGVVGTLTSALDGGGNVVYSFARTTAGAAVPVDYATPMFTGGFDQRRGDIAILEIGQNDGTNDATAIIARQRAYVDQIDRALPRFLIGGLHTSDASFRAPMEKQFGLAWGPRFVNLRAYLSSSAAMQRAGITPTSADSSDMAAGRVPASLRSDSVHLNSAGYTQKAFIYRQRLLELGWIS